MSFASPDLWLPFTGWLLPLLYIELHYRWLPGASRYYRREPEILADLPSRIAPGQKPPLLLLVKDAHRFPIRLERVEVAVDTGAGPRPWTTVTVKEDLADLWWHRVVELERPEGMGYVKWLVIFHYRSRGRLRSCTTHNLPGLPGQGLPQAAMRTYLASDDLPGAPRGSGLPVAGTARAQGQGVVWGDLHHHSGLTEDAIEFGAPLEASQAAATALGLGFVAVTDHSYDLDDRIGSWHLTDPELTKWHTSRRRMAELNRESGAALLLPGEEVSVRNSQGRNAHALVLDHPHFLPGSGDGGERALRPPSELNLGELAATVQSPAVVIAAHPYQPVPWLQRLIVGRDNWSAPDLATPGIAGLQIMNGRLDAGFRRGLSAWKRLLLQGRRTYIYAGSDSHGDFNRFRVIGLPFVYLTEREGMTLGSCRTGVLGVKPGDQPGITAAMREGRCLISNGPSIDLEVRGDGSSAGPGGTMPGGDLEVRLRLASTPEFGPLTRLRLYRGIIGAPREDLLVDLVLGSGRYDFSWRHKFHQAQPGYLRAEVQSRLPGGNVFGNRRGLALTNPVWIEGPG